MRVVLHGGLPHILEGDHRMKLTMRAAVLSLGLLLPGAGAVQAQEPMEDPNLIPMQANLFLPAEKTVAAGTMVTWVNLDAEDHNVIALDFTYGSPFIKTGETWSFTYAAPGTYAYLCDLHRGMEGVIVVS